MYELITKSKFAKGDEIMVTSIILVVIIAIIIIIAKIRSSVEDENLNQSDNILRREKKQ